MKQVFSQKLSLICTIILLNLVAGCVSITGNFAKLRHDDGVKQTFESFTVAPGYNYYYYGRSSYPRAFVGISKEFAMDSSLWSSIDLTSEDLRTWIWVHANRYPGDLKRYGSTIMGPNGEQIGVWYSLEDWQHWARIELIEGGKVKIGTPINDETKTISLIRI